MTILSLKVITILVVLFIVLLIVIAIVTSPKQYRDGDNDYMDKE